MPNPNGDEYPDGFLQPWLWNFFLSFVQYYGTVLCAGIGMWGLFWWNDGGLMMNRCYLTTGGTVFQYEGLISS